MERFLDRADRCLYSGYGISFVVHLGLIGLLLLAMLPLGLDRDPLDLQVTVEDAGADLVILDVTLSQPDVADEPMMLDLIGAQSEAPFEITAPQAQFVTGDQGTGKNHATAGTVAGANGGRGQASFFGTQATGNRFVYVLDVSGSMNQGNGRRLRRAVNELLRSIDQLHEDQLFYVLLFANATRQMFDEDALVPTMLPATTENKTRVREWITQVKANGGTHPQRALHVGLNLTPSAVFFLSDGKFNKPKATGFFGGEAIDAKTVVARTNPGNIPVHTIAFEEPSSRKNMNEISEMTGGDFRFVLRSGRVSGGSVATKPSSDTLTVTDVKAKDSLAEQKAAKWLGYASDMETLENDRMARYYYTKILSEFPETKTAAEVRRRQKK